ncbi:MAG: hypothetical protein FWG88_11590 [Oscillospiraceae bacterium]|nr:hypothetical protein [Oscillospiraceae bacterium]
MLLSSYVFYWFAGGFFALAAISVTTISIYLCGLWAGKLRENKAKTALRRTPLIICLSFNFALLAFFKYTNLFLPNMDVLLVAGISFYTFQAAGYMVDIYTGKIQAERNFFKAALFLSFFPQLIQGPISRYSDIAQDLFAGHGWDWDRARSGIQRIIWGYLMKMAIANHAALIVNNVYANFRNYGGAIIIFGVLMYCFQVYTDFAGGINITIGIAKIIGINLPENFRQPFFASSLADYWRRWHITLGSWLRDYLFYPLILSAPMAKLSRFSRKNFGNAVGKLIPSCIGTFCIYFIVGIWHDLTFNYLIFGFLNGFIISCSLFAEPLIEKLRDKTGINGSKPGFGRVFSALRTFAILGFLRYFVRAASFRTALSMFKQTLLHIRISELWNGTLLGLGVDKTGYLVLTIGIIVLLLHDYLTEIGKDVSEMLNKSKPILQFAILVLAMFSLVAFSIFSGDAHSASFIYGGF